MDDNDSKSAKQSNIFPTKSNPNADLRQSIAKATKLGLKMISQQFKPIAIQIPNQILNERLVPNDIFEAIDSHLLRDLPPIIGSSGFSSWSPMEINEKTVEISEITIGITSTKKKYVFFLI